MPLTLGRDEQWSKSPPRIVCQLPHASCLMSISVNGECNFEVFYFILEYIACEDSYLSLLYSLLGFAFIYFYSSESSWIYIVYIFISSLHNLKIIKYCLPKKVNYELTLVSEEIKYCEIKCSTVFFLEEHFLESRIATYGVTDCFNFFWNNLKILAWSGKFVPVKKPTEGMNSWLNSHFVTCLTKSDKTLEKTRSCMCWKIK